MAGKEKTDKKASKSGGGARKIGRQKAKSDQYTASGRREKNKRKRMVAMANRLHRRACKLHAQGKEMRGDAWLKEPLPFENGLRLKLIGDKSSPCGHRIV